MKDKIAELYGKRKYGSLWEGIEQRIDAKAFADQILALPVEGVIVKKEDIKIPDRYYNIEEYPLTIKEALEVLPKTVEYIGYECSAMARRWSACEHMDNCASCALNEALTTSDGGKLVKEE